MPATLGKPKSKKELVHGQPVKKTCGNLELEVDSCQSFLVHFQHPKYESHRAQLLEAVDPPRR